MASDLFLISPLAILIPLAPASDNLTFHEPVSSLFSFSIIFSMSMKLYSFPFSKLGAIF